MLIKQSSSNKVIPFFMVDSGDHITGKTGLTTTVTISKNGSAFGAPAGAVTEIGSGWYKIAGNATDSATLGALLVHATATGADPFDVIHEVVAFDVDLGTVTVGTNNDKVGYALTSAYDPAKTAASPAQVQTELGTYGGLKPTVAGRTLDVNATGEAGLDWGNIGAPTTAQALSATTISTSQTVGSVTNPVTLTAAYDLAKTAAQPGSAMTLTSGERTTTAGVIWNTLTSALTTVGSIGKLLVDNVNATISSAVGDTPGTTTLLTRIASVLTITSGKVDVNDKTGFSLTAAYDAAKTAAAPGAAMTLTTGERDAIATAEWNWAGTPGAGTIGKKVSDSLPGITPGTAGGLFIAGSNVPTNVNLTGNITGNLVGNVTGSVHDIVVPDNIGPVVRDVSNATPAAGSLGADVKAGIGGGTGGGISWDDALPGSHAAGTAGYIIGHNLDAQVSTRLSTAGYVIPPNTSQIATATRDISNASPPAGSWGAATNAAAAAGDPWSTPLPNAAYAPGTAGDIIGQNIDAKISSRLATSGYTAPYTPTVIAQTTRDINNQTPATNSWGAATNAAASAGDPWTANIGTYTTPGTAGKLMNDNINATISSRMAASAYVVPPTAASVAAATRDVSNASPAAGSLGQDVKNAASAGDPWSTPLPNVSYAPGTAGDIIGQNIDAKISTRLPTSTYVPAPSAIVVAQSVRDVDNTSPAANSLGADVKSGGADPLSKPVPGSYAAGTAGRILGDNLDAKVSTRSTYAGADTSGTTTLLTRIPSPITVTGGKVDVADKTGFSLTPAYDAAKQAAKPGDEMAVSTTDEQSIALTVWGTLTSVIATAGSIGKLTVDQLNASVGSRLAAVNYVAPDNASIAGIKLKTDTIPASPASVTDIPTAAQNAAATRDVSNATPAAGSLGQDVKTGSLSTDPWAQQLPGSYPPGSGGNIVGTRIDAAVSSRLPTANITLISGAVTVGTNNDKTGYSLVSGAENAIADAILRRDWQAVSGESSASVLNALRLVRNRWEVTGDGTLRVYKEDGTTIAWTRQVSADASAQPIVGVS